MKISIIGSGNIGGTLARLLVKAGHEVALANTRGPASLQNFVDELGSKLHPVTIENAISYSDLIILSIPWRNIDSFPVFNALDKIIVDTSNPYKADGTIFELGNDISSFKVVNHFPGGKVVKAFNTIWSNHLANLGSMSKPLDDRRVIPFAGNDKKSKATVSQLIEDIGFGPADTGNLVDGSKLQNVGGVLYNKDITLREANQIIDNFKKHLV